MAPQSESSSGSEGNPKPVLRSGDSTSRRVFEDVLKQTAVVKSNEDGLHAAELEILVEVAKRFPGAEFQLSPVVIELVKATLARQMKVTDQTSEQFVAVVDRVARTLFENPETHERLRSLWERLSAVE